MRARYAAFALGLTKFVVETTHPEGVAVETDRQAWAHSIEAFSASTDFSGLDVLEASEAGDRGTVRFRAVLVQHGKDVSFTEQSQFVRESGRWLYVSGEVTAG